ncbi:MAG: hypothetical protein SWH54_14735 [Thermodesulfobacteriota bacterium]|nr:hypothetical protein [Thermodesulfobacteriota bacterium]
MPNQDVKEMLHMHQFYTEEARHQRSMMWETVKWFTPILTLIAGGWAKYYIDEYLPCKNFSIWLLLITFSILGICLCICCILLLRSFYRTNLKYISMFAKVEEEIEFDLKERGDSKYFPGDKHFTWEKWRDERRYGKRSSKQKEENNLNAKQYTSVDYLNNKLTGIGWKNLFKKVTILSLMQSVFIIFGLIFLGSSLLLIINIST